MICGTRSRRSGKGCCRCQRPQFAQRTVAGSGNPGAQCVGRQAEQPVRQLVPSQWTRRSRCDCRPAAARQAPRRAGTIAARCRDVGSGTRNWRPVPALHKGSVDGSQTEYFPRTQESRPSAPTSSRAVMRRSSPRVSSALAEAPISTGFGTSPGRSRLRLPCRLTFSQSSQAINDDSRIQPSSSMPVS
jgi:hypothetical protein